MDDQEQEDYAYSEDNFYYDVDYEEDFLEGLDPSLLASISPDLIVAYFESATADSLILISLPPQDCGGVTKEAAGGNRDFNRE